MKVKNTAKTRREAQKTKAVPSLKKAPPLQAAPIPAPAPTLEEVSALEFAELLDQYSIQPFDVLPKSCEKGRLIYEINLEEGLPTVEEALLRMRIGLEEAKRSGCPIARLIHGYGSSGRGGAIGRAVRQKLKNIIPGEEFDIFNPAARRLLDRYPPLRRDPDLGRYNHGMTLVILRR